MLTNGVFCGIIEIQKKADCHIRSMTVLHRSGNSTPIQPDNRRPRDIITHSFGFCKRFSEYRLFCDGIFSRTCWTALGVWACFLLPTPPKPKFLQKSKIPKYTVRSIVFLRRGETVPPAIRRAFPLGQRTNGGMDRSNKTAQAGFMPFVFLRTYRLPPCAKARGNGFF